MQTVYYNGLPLMIDDAAMVELGWTNGQTVNEAQLREGIAANARSLCRYVQKQNLDIDVSDLAEKCGHTRLA